MSHADEIYAGAAMKLLRQVEAAWSELGGPPGYLARAMLTRHWELVGASAPRIQTLEGNGWRMDLPVRSGSGDSAVRGLIARPVPRPGGS